MFQLVICRFAELDWLHSLVRLRLVDVALVHMLTRHYEFTCVFSVSHAVSE